MRLTSKVAAVALAAATLASATGCGSSGSAENPTVQDSTGTVSLDEKADGTTVHAHLGDIVTVTLHSTYWSFLPTDGLALQPFAPIATAAGSACPHVMGTGCGSVTATYNIGRVGTSVLRAHRDTCGEALRCLGKQGDWSVTVVAT